MQSAQSEKEKKKKIKTKKQLLFFFLIRLDLKSSILTFPDAAWKLGFQLACTMEVKKHEITSPLGT